MRTVDDRCQRDEAFLITRDPPEPSPVTRSEPRSDAAASDSTSPIGADGNAPDGNVAFSSPPDTGDADGNVAAPSSGSRVASRRDDSEGPEDNLTEHAAFAFRSLGPDQLLDAIDAAGWLTNGRVSALNSYENRVYSVGLDAGGFVVAKFYRPERWSDEAILEEHAFSAELAARDLPAIAPLKDPDGNTLFHHGPFRLALYPRVGGRPPELDNPEHLAVIGRSLARVHLVGDLQAFEHRPDIGLDRLGEDARDTLLASPHLPGHIAETWATLTDELLDVIADRIDDVDADELRLHGDLHPGNILYGADGSPQLLDFDDAGTGPAIQDLWMCLSGERQYAQARLGDLLDGYHEFREFDLNELALIEPLRTLRIIHHAGWLASRWEDPAFQRGFPQFAEGRFWDEHLHTLREQQAALDERPLAY